MLLRQVSSAFSEQEHAERANGGTNQPWQVAALPDLSQSQAATEALEAAAANNNTSSNGGVGATGAAPASGGGTAVSEEGVTRRGAGGWRLAPDAQVQGVLPSRNSPGSTWWSSADLETRGRSNVTVPGVEEEEEAQLEAALQLSLQQARLDEDRRVRLRAEAFREGQSDETAAASVAAEGGGGGEVGAGVGPAGGAADGTGRVSTASTASSSSSSRGRAQREEQQQRRPTSAIPHSSQEEEEMLAMALALSLLEAEAAGAASGSVPLDPVSEVQGIAGTSLPGPVARAVAVAGAVPPDPVTEAPVPPSASAGPELTAKTAASDVGSAEEIGASRSSTSTPRSYDSREQAAGVGMGGGLGGRIQRSGSTGSGVVQRVNSGGGGAFRSRVSPRQLQQHIQQQQQGTSAVAPAAGIAVAHMPRRQHQQQQQQGVAGGVGLGPLGLGAAGRLESRQPPQQLGDAREAAAAAAGSRGGAVAAAPLDEGSGQAESPGAAVDVDVVPAGVVGGVARVEAVGLGPAEKAVHAEVPQQLFSRRTSR